jgi:spermidine/putrescine transport system ATP-binding protein/putrescine transport system ATP-binding protein
VAGAAVLVVRPEDVRLVDVGASLLGGVVLDTQFYGGRSTVSIEVVGHAQPVTMTCPGTAPVGRGDHVHVAWPADKGVVLAAE